MNSSGICSHTRNRQKLSLSAHLLDRIYEIDCDVTAGSKQNMSTGSDELVPQKNYVALPSIQIIHCVI